MAPEKQAIFSCLVHEWYNISALHLLISIFPMNPSVPAAWGYLLALLATVLWSTVFPLVRVLPLTLSPVELAFWRWLLTFSCMLPFGLGALMEHWTLVRQNWKWLLPAGVLGFSMYSILMFEAGHTTDATNLSLIAATAPVFMAFFARFFLGEKLAPLQLGGLVVAVFGVVVLVLHGDFRRLTTLSFTIGDIWMLLAASFFAVYSILVRKRPTTMPQNVSMLAMLACGLLALCPFMAIEVTNSGYSFPDMQTFLIMVYIALIPTLIGYLLWNRSVDYIGAARAGIVYYSIPLFSSLEAVVFLHETISFSQIVGGMLIVGGILLSSLNVLKARRHF